MWEVITAWMIMHNMTVKEERVNSVYDQESDFQSELIEP
jgi:hypothetical protein